MANMQTHTPQATEGLCAHSTNLCECGHKEIQNAATKDFPQRSPKCLCVNLSVCCSESACVLFALNEKQLWRTLLALQGWMGLESSSTLRENKGHSGIWLAGFIHLLLLMFSAAISAHCKKLTKTLLKTPAVTDSLNGCYKVNMIHSCRWNVFMAQQPHVFRGKTVWNMNQVLQMQTLHTDTVWAWIFNLEMRCQEICFREWFSSRDEL